MCLLLSFSRDIWTVSFAMCLRYFGENQITFLPYVALYTFCRHLGWRQQKWTKKKSRRRAQTINKNEALHGEHPFIFRNILLIVSFYLLFGPFLLAATKIWHFCFIFHIYTEWHWHLSSASSVPDDKRRWQKTTLLHIDVNGEKKS